jgi:hypothetical protein
VRSLPPIERTPIAVDADVARSDRFVERATVKDDAREDLGFGTI